MDFFTGGSVIMDYGILYILAWSNGLKGKMEKMPWFFYKQAAFHFTRC